MGEARRKRLKYKVLAPIADDLGLAIRNWDSIESDKDYNAYYFSYQPVGEYLNDRIKPEVKLETALVSYAFPTEIRSVGNLAYDYLKIENQELAERFGLAPFEMRVQSLSRTFLDKVFALCDYYLEGKSKRYSRHLYDVNKLRELVEINDELRALALEVREHRGRLSICPSAKAGIDIRRKIHEFCDADFYKTDYGKITQYFAADSVPYEDTIRTIREVADELF